MDAKEIVSALRESLPPKIDYAELVGAEGFAHGACYVWDDPLPYLMSNAADLLESQQAQLAAERIKYSELQRYNVDCTKQFGMLQMDKVNLQNLLTESQRRERAAVEDAEQGSVCRTCHYLNNGCDPLNLDAGCHKWQWRGPQEAGKGEAE